MPVFETPGSVSLQIKLPSGRVVVTTVDEPRTSVELVSLGRRGPDAVDDVSVTAEEHHGRHTICIEQKEKFRWGPIQITCGEPDIETRITCPPGSDLELSGGSTDLRVSGDLGDVTVRPASGDARLESARGKLQMKTASGNISVGTVVSEASLTTVSGDLAVERADGQLTVRAVSGDVTMGLFTGYSVSRRHRVTSRSAPSRQERCKSRPCPATYASALVRDARVDRCGHRLGRPRVGTGSRRCGARGRRLCWRRACRPAPRQEGERRRLDRARE